jgi:transposase
VAIDADIRQLVRASAACRRLMTIPGVGQLTALAFTAAIDDPGRSRRSRDIGAYLGLVPRRYQSGEVDYTGSMTKERRPATPRSMALRCAVWARAGTRWTWAHRPGCPGKQSGARPVSTRIAERMGNGMVVALAKT